MSSLNSTEVPKFDFRKQDYFDSKGNIVNIEYENFPCTRCKSPGKAQEHNCYYEVYKCISCNNTFNVS